MSIKADRWIKEMSETCGMIEPFSAEQVRHIDGRSIISYGTSSYGYDVRCASELEYCYFCLFIIQCIHNNFLCGDF